MTFFSKKRRLEWVEKQILNISAKILQVKEIQEIKKDSGDEEFLFILADIKRQHEDELKELNEKRNALRLAVQSELTKNKKGAVSHA